MSLLRLEHVTRRFGGLVAVDDVSLAVPGDGITAPIASATTAEQMDSLIRSVSLELLHAFLATQPMRASIAARLTTARAAWLMAPQAPRTEVRDRRLRPETPPAVPHAEMAAYS